MTMILFRLFVQFFLLVTASAPKPEAETVMVAKPAIHSTEENAEFIPWSVSRRLSWEDFLCAPLHNTDAVALTSTSLGISYRVKNGILTYEITCNFAKQKSWVLLKTPYILTHEQGHFDITEIFARKLHQALQNQTFNAKTYKLDLNKIYNNIVSEKEAFQEAYDSETDHSRNKRVQREWLDRIDDLLAETEPFANYP